MCNKNVQQKVKTIFMSMKKRLIIAQFALVTSIVNAQSITKSMLKLPDTGQTGDYTTTVGEDAD